MNQQRRAALKLIATGAAVAHAPGLLATGHTNTSAENPPAAIPVHLQIDILSGDNIPGDSVIISNRTTQALTLEHFRPGVIACKDRMIDLNALCQSQPLRLPAGACYASTDAEWLPLADNTGEHPLEYLMAEDAVAPISERTDLISIQAMVVNRQAVVMSPGASLT